MNYSYFTLTYDTRSSSGILSIRLTTSIPFIVFIITLFRSDQIYIIHSISICFYCACLTLVAFFFFFVYCCHPANGNKKNPSERDDSEQEFMRQPLFDLSVDEFYGCVFIHWRSHKQQSRVLFKQKKQDSGVGKIVVDVELTRITTLSRFNTLSSCLRESKRKIGFVSLHFMGHTKHANNLRNTHRTHTLC